MMARGLVLLVGMLVLLSGSLACGSRRAPEPAAVAASASAEPSSAAPEGDELDQLDAAIDEILDEPDPGTQPTPTGAPQELERLRERLRFPRWLFFPLVVLLAWAASRTIARDTRFLLRLGVKRRRLVTIGGALLSISIWIWAFVAILGRLLRAAPTITLGVLTLAVVASLLVLRRQLENLAAGVALAVRSRLREGDRIAVGEHEGVVRRVGFFRVELSQPDGSRLYLPNHTVSTEAVTIGPARYSVPLSVSLTREEAWGAEEIERARQLASLSPYRDPSGQVVVDTRGEGEHRLVIQLQVWAPRLVDAAEQHLRRQLDRHVDHRPRQGPDGDRRQGERRQLERRGR